MPAERPSRQGPETSAKHVQAGRPGRRRTAWGLAIVFVLGAGLGIWQASRLWGLPDVGDPFDVGKFVAISVPTERNAFQAYGEATALATKPPDGWWPDVEIPDEKRPITPKVRAWLEENREALEFWRQGTERPDALYHRPDTLTFETSLPVTQELRLFARMAKLRGDDLRAKGDSAGAWRWYRAILRSSRHTGRYGVIVERLVGIALHKSACEALTRWAADPMTDAAMLRRALSEVAAIDASTVPASEALKCEYLMITRQLDGPTNWVAMSWPPPGYQDKWYYHYQGVRDASIVLSRDRERCRRLTQLVFANWLAQCDKPPRQRAKGADIPAPAPFLYEPDPSEPPAARAISPKELAEQFSRSLLAAVAFPDWPRFDQALTRERVYQARLVVSLAEQLYLRERGALPKAPEDLVGAYLERIPDDYEAKEPEKPTWSGRGR